MPGTGAVGCLLLDPPMVNMKNGQNGGNLVENSLRNRQSHGNSLFYKFLQIFVIHELFALNFKHDIEDFTQNHRHPRA